MENLTIEKSKVLKAFNETTEENKQLLTTMFGKDVFDQKITDRIKSWEDVLSANGLTIQSYSDYCKNLHQNEKDHFANRLITAALNEGWLPNWNDNNERKYRLWLEYTAGSGFSLDGVVYGHTYANVGSRLYFKSEELARYAWKQFGTILVQYYNS